jgi:transcriptional/translational regulatory protein YebC/TACO1
MFEAAIEAGANDVATTDDAFEIICALEQLSSVRDSLTKKFGDPLEAKVTWIPKNTIAVDGDVAKTLFKLIEILEDNDDVQSVVANYEVPEGFSL